MVSPPGERGGLPTARRLIFRAAVTGSAPAASARDRRPSRCRSRGSDSSLGSSDETSTSRASRSRIAFWYSVRFSRRKVSVRPGFGLRSGRRDRASVSSEATRALVGVLVGPRQSRGRHVARTSLRTTFSQASGLLFRGPGRGIEREAAGFHLGVMATHAVAVQGGALGRRTQADGRGCQHQGRHTAWPNRPPHQASLLLGLFYRTLERGWQPEARVRKHRLN